MITMFILVLLLTSIIALIDVVIGLLVAYGVILAVIALGILSVIHGILTVILWMIIRCLTKHGYWGKDFLNQYTGIIRTMILIMSKGLYICAICCTIICIISIIGLILLLL